MRKQRQLVGALLLATARGWAQAETAPPAGDAPAPLPTVPMAIDNLPHANRAVVWGEPRTFGLDALLRW